MDGKTSGIRDLIGLQSDYLKCGIMSVTDMGHKSGIGFEIKEAWEGRIEIITGGVALFRKGAYGSFLGSGVETADEIRQAVFSNAARGADFIKIINSGIVKASGIGFVSEGGFSVGQLACIVDAAREKGLKISCHANGDRAIRQAVSAGVSSIEHGFFISGEILDMMAEKGIAWTPTANALLSIKTFLDDEEQRNIEEIVDGHIEMISYAATKGVRLNVGTDSGSKGIRHGEAFFSELRLFSKAGLSLEQIINAACMDRDEISNGNYLIIQKDFIETGALQVWSTNRLVQPCST